MLVRKTRVPLWRDSHYDMTPLADGARYDTFYAARGGDYSCRHASFEVVMKRWAREHDCVVRCEPVMHDGAEGQARVGTAVQFFWDLRRGDRPPHRFRDVDDDYVERTGVVGWGPQTRPEHEHFPYDSP